MVSYAQLVACGLSATVIAHRVDHGRLHRLHRGVYAVGHDGLDDCGRIFAAVLAVGSGAVASHESAARLQSILPAGTRVDRGVGPVEVTTVAGRRGRSRSGIRVHAIGTWDARDLRWVGPVPVTSAARTVLDLAVRSGRDPAERMLAEALRGRLTDEREIRSLVTRSSGHHGVGVVASLIEAGPAFDRSVAERLFLELVRRSGLPEPQTNVWAGGFEVDALWEDLDVVAEFDSSTFHGDRVAFRKDRRKSARLQAAGYDVVPVIWADLLDSPELVAATVASVLAVARIRRRGS